MRRVDAWGIDVETKYGLCEKETISRGALNMEHMLSALTRHAPPPSRTPGPFVETAANTYCDGFWDTSQNLSLFPSHHPAGPKPSRNARLPFDFRTTQPDAVPCRPLGSSIIAAVVPARASELVQAPATASPNSAANARPTRQAPTTDGIKAPSCDARAAAVPTHGEPAMSPSRPVDAVGSIGHRRSVRTTMPARLSTTAHLAPPPPLAPSRVSRRPAPTSWRPHDCCPGS